MRKNTDTFHVVVETGQVYWCVFSYSSFGLQIWTLLHKASVEQCLKLIKGIAMTDKLQPEQI